MVVTYNDRSRNSGIWPMNYTRWSNHEDKHDVDCSSEIRFYERVTTNTRKIVLVPEKRYNFRIENSISLDKRWTIMKLLKRGSSYAEKEHPHCILACCSQCEVDHNNHKPFVVFSHGRVHTISLSVRRRKKPKLKRILWSLLAF